MLAYKIDVLCAPIATSTPESQEHSRATLSPDSEDDIFSPGLPLVM
jgi:hypothetical protein